MPDDLIEKAEAAMAILRICKQCGGEIANKLLPDYCLPCLVAAMDAIRDADIAAVVAAVAITRPAAHREPGPKQENRPKYPWSVEMERAMWCASCGTAHFTTMRCPTCGRLQPPPPKPVETK